MIRIGFTGPQGGMNHQQMLLVSCYSMNRIGQDIEYRHGQCVGSDEQFHFIVLSDGGRIWLHPGLDSGGFAYHRAECAGAAGSEPAQPFLVRDRAIVDATNELWATPDRAEYRRSGTWSTVRYARRLGRRITFFRTDGTIHVENAANPIPRARLKAE